MKIKFQLTGIGAALTEMVREVDRNAQRAMSLGALDVAEDARANHVFQNRTGKLEKSIRANNAVGSLSHNNLYVIVSAHTKYAQFVEDRVTSRAWAYLAPAEKRMRSRFVGYMNDALTRAVERGRT